MIELRDLLLTTITFTACSTPSATDTLDDIASYDLTTWRGQTELIPTYEHVVPQCAPQGVFLAFPRLGECVGTSDTENFPCRHPSSSLEHVMLGDVRVEPSPAGAYVRSGSIVGGDVTLDGHGSAATFPVTPVELPNATMSATYDATAKELRIDWSTDVPAASVLVIFSEGYGAWLCHTTGSSYAFPLQVEPPYFETAVQAFAPVELHDTPFGEVRVWRSGEMAGQTGPTTTTR